MITGMYRGRGDVEHLRFMTALLQQDPDNENRYLAQFDAKYLSEAYGWKSFPKSDFTHVKGDTDDK